ncbi:ROK family protein [Parvibaculaceae bacterium PLY_AMNH_Bact1]|nr:ROK family protein [Parvibaculaceae bacterium PLY_AMNH_Bact1]
MRLGVDLGGTKIEAILMDKDGKIVDRKRVPTPRGYYDKTVLAIRDLVGDVSRDALSTLPVGIGIPGTVSPATGLIKNANSTWLIGKPFDKDLEAALERPVRLANDADCFALSEAADGAGAGHVSVFGVILGTGVGGGLVINGGLVTGPNAIAGEWGHNALPWPNPSELPGPSCYCGKTGCIETWLSGPSLEQQATSEGLSDLRALEIADAARSGESTALTLIEQYADRLARALAGVINILDPNVIVLGGGLSAMDQLYSLVPQKWGAHVFSDTVVTTLKPNTHGDSSGVRGAAWLWPDTEVH